MKKSLHKHPLAVAISTASIILGLGVTSNLALAQTEENGTVEEVLVSGYRGSQAKALNEKRNSANVADSIVAEDIGKMPDLNLSESLQRVPGVAITREG